MPSFVSTKACEYLDLGSFGLEEASPSTGYSASGTRLKTPAARQSAIAMEKKKNKTESNQVCLRIKTTQFFFFFLCSGCFSCN